MSGELLLYPPKRNGLKDPDVKHEAKFMGKMKLSKEEADQIFARNTAKFLDRMGFILGGIKRFIQ